MNRVANLDAQLGNYSPEIVVVGSCFMDYIGYVDHLPQVGETMHSENFQKGFGGKGANQSVAAGRLGAKAAMVGMVGGDGDGADFIKQLQKNGIDTTYMFRDAESANGLAMIFVDTKTSNNEIVICPNATNKLTLDFIRQRTDNFKKIFPKSVRYMICQNEIPLEVTLESLKEAHSRGIYTIFNAAPAPKPAEVERIKPYLRYVSLFCPNEVEAALITGVKVVDKESVNKAIAALQALGIKDVVITLGKAGFAVCVGGTEPIHCSAKRVKAVDTTGAGDCFVGSMTYYLSKGHSLLDSCKFANACSAISVTRKGTQTSFPSAEEVRHLMK